MERTTARFTGTVHAAESNPQRTKFKGYASVFDTLIDAYVPTIIERGAFAKTLAEAGQRSRVKVLYQHNQDWPIGVPDILREDQHGLYIEALLSPTERGKEASQLLKDGVLTDMSIGFDPVQSYNGADGYRHITEIRLWEVSLVTHGANRDARVTDVHGRQRIDRLLADFDRHQAQQRERKLLELEMALLDSYARSVGR